MIKEGSDFFQNAKFCPILVIYNLPDNQHVQFCMNSKFDAILQPVISYFIYNVSFLFIPYLLPTFYVALFLLIFLSSATVFSSAFPFLSLLLFPLIFLSPPFSLIEATLLDSLLLHFSQRRNR